MAKVTVNAQLQDIFGNAFASATFGGLNVELCGYGSAIPRVAGTALLAQTMPVERGPATGAVSFTIYDNDAITPAGTYYTVQATDPNGNVIQTGAYQFLLSTTPSVVQAISVYTAANNALVATATFPNATAAGNTILLLACNYNRFAPNAFTDSQGNTYSSPFGLQDSQGGGGLIQGGVATNIVGGANTVTITNGNGGYIGGLIAIELQNAAYDTETGTDYPTIQSVYPMPLSLVTTVASELLIVVGNGGPALSTSGGRTSVTSATRSDGLGMIEAWAGLAGAAGTYTDTLSTSNQSSQIVSGVMIAFKPSSSSNATRSVDLSTLTPYVPDQVPAVASTLTATPVGFGATVQTGTSAGAGAPQGDVSVTASAAPIFDGSAGNVFELLLNQNVISSTTANLVAGQYYTFNIQQPASGPTYTFAWPANLPIAPIVAMGNGKQTTVLVACRSNGTLIPVGATLYL